MKFKWFRYPVEGDADLEDLNVFLAGHQVVGVTRNWVQGPNGAVLAFVVEYGDDAAGVNRPAARGAEAMRDLSEAELALYNRLRDLRKQIAGEEGVPVWSLFGNAAIRQIVKQAPEAIAGLASVPGVGQARAQRHGGRILEILRDARVETPPKDAPEESADAGTAGS